MYRILLVDDEPAVLNGLYETIPWAEYGFETVEQATDGIQALALLQKQTFDVILTDICMPDMDGLTLLKTVRTLYPSMNCIILTAYSEFDYVLKALRLGVDNFLLKPINQDELAATLQQCLKRFEHPTDHAVIDDGSFNRNVLYRWMTGTLSEEELDHRADLLGINLFCRNYCVISLHALTLTCKTEDCADSIRHTLSAGFDCYVVTDEYNCTYFILGGHSITTEELFTLLAPHTRADCHIFIGQTVENCNRIAASYQGLVNVASYALLFDTGQPICVEALRQKITALQAAKPLSALPQLLRRQSSPGTLVELTALLHELLVHTVLTDYRCAIIAYLNCLQLALEKAHLSQKLLTDFLTATLETLLPLNNKKVPYEQLCHIFEQAQRMLDSEFEDASPIIRRVISFLKNAYNQPVSLKTLAQQLSVNPSYLGYLFKEETGIYFSDFLNNLRMQHAEELLLHTDYTVGEIAEMSGYSTTAYFNQIFKKTHSLSPAKYRQSNKSIQ